MTSDEKSTCTDNFIVLISNSVLEVALLRVCVQNVWAYVDVNRNGNCNGNGLDGDAVICTHVYIPSAVALIRGYANLNEHKNRYPISMWST